MPVLSVQMTVVEPSVSTLESFLTSTLRFAMRCAATESAIVSVGSSPSGTLATMMPIAKTAAPSVSMPTKSLPSAKKKMPRPTAIIEMSCESRAMFFCSGESRSSTLCVSPAILPNSVRMPVAYTTARPWPEHGGASR